MYCQNWDIDLPTRPTSATRNDCPAASYDSTDLSFPQWSPSCIQWLNWPQLPTTIIQLHSATQLTATRIKHLAVSPRLDLRQPPSSNVQLRTSTTRPYQLSTSPIKLKTTYNHHGLYTHACNSGNKSSLFFICYLTFCSLHCLWLSLLTRIKLKIICRVDMLIGSAIGPNHCT